MSRLAIRPHIRPRAEVLLALELVALTSFAFSRPVLSVFGDTPELFLSRGASRLDIVVFALAVSILPLLVVVPVGVVSGLFGERARHVTHLCLVAACAGLGAWHVVHDPTGRRGWWLPAWAIAAGVAGAVAALRWRGRSRPATASFLQYASVGAIVFLVQFLWLSPVSGQLLRPQPVANERAMAAAVAALDGEPPPVVFVVLDEMPTMSLLDGSGAIDRDLFPALAGLADEATWYRNHTTVAGMTVSALPALATGSYPDVDAVETRTDPDNIFNLLASRYDLSVRESVTHLCPSDLCPRHYPSAVRSLVGDAVDWWRVSVSAELITALVPALPGATGPDRYDTAEAFIDEVDVVGDEQPAFTFLHLVMPHYPWQFTDEGDLYETSPLEPGAFGFSWAGGGTEVGRQRHLLQVQATDKLVGRLLDRLRDEGVYDDALVIVTGDHGVSFVPNVSRRELVGGNEEQVLWTPLLVKRPGQSRGAVDDANVLSIDVVPTIAAELGIDVPWELDGVPADSAGDERAPHRKPYVSGYQPDAGAGPLRPVDGLPYVELDTEEMFARVLAADPVPATGRDAVWRLTDHGDVVGEEVDSYGTAEPVDGSVTVSWPASFDDIDTRDPLPLELVASTDLPVGSTVAFALDGTIAAMAEVQDFAEGGGRLVQGMLLPRVFHDGDHELEAFVVTGDVAAPVLAPVDVAL